MTVAALNDLDMLACDIKGGYLTAECRKIICTISGDKFGIEEGVILIVKMVLYGLKISRADFRTKLARALNGLNYQPTKADYDVWFRE